jgi:hypothetical protein
MSTTPKQIIGSISNGTMRPEDLIPNFLDVLDSLDHKQAEAIRQEHEETIATLDKEDLTDEEMESQDWLLNEVLFNALDSHALPYFYFGAHPGDGADYGFWLSEEVNQQVQDNGGLVVSDLEQVPADFTGEVLHVNDHGNATLFCRDEGSAVWREVWSIV